jgi:eukaryotic-like serine/threonine-protein kinase
MSRYDDAFGAVSASRWWVMVGDEADPRSERDAERSETRGRPNAESGPAVARAPGALDPTVPRDPRRAATTIAAGAEGSAGDPAPLPAALRAIRAYEVLESIGGGGMGIVYRARDVERGQVVALKTLSNVALESFTNLKQEFRAAAEIAHDNLVTLHELLLEDGVPYFTMELVEGTDFVTHVRDDAAGPSQRDPIDEAGILRLRAAARQLALGVSTLHAAGKLHRDLKPSNVMVTPEGRVVILDFGLALDADPGAFDHRVVGTPAYMAPEQTVASPIGPAADWYAVGVMIYEAITGELPFGRTVSELVKAFVEPPPRPSRLAPDVPADLDELCADLLLIAPERRPEGPEVLRRLGVTPPRVFVTTENAPLVDRERELAILGDAFADAAGGTVVVWLEGPSGTGKTALVRHFLDQVGGAVLQSRCHERESFSFKAFDGIVDGLAERLRQKRTVPIIEPLDAGALSRLFPTLRSIVQAASPTAGLDPQAMRQRGFRALKRMIADLAVVRPLVLWLDDVQWSDDDSADLLAELLAGPRPANILWIASARSGHGDASFHRTLREVQGLDRREVALEPLSTEASAALASSTARGATGVGLSEQDIARIAELSLGNPLLVEQLVRDTLTSGTTREGVPTLQQVVVDRLERLPADARRMLEAVAVAGRIPQRVAFEVADPFRDPWAVVALLRAENLVRSGGERGLEQLEPWHDGIRESVARHLAPEETARYHGAIAAALAQEAERHPGRVDAAQLATHFFGAGMTEPAGRHALEAARRATSALAFERAAKLYALARRCGAGNAAELMRLEADALVDGGRCAEAAPLYLAAAAESPIEAALELRRLAAEQLLVSGNVDEGAAELRPVLQALGLRYPRTPVEATVSVLWQIGRLAIGGYHFEPRATPPERLLRQIDLCWTSGKGLISVDSVRGAYFLLRMLRLALRAGEPHRASRALGIVGMMIVFQGDERSHRRGMAMIEEAERLAPADDPYLEGVLVIDRGTAEMSIGRFDRGMALLEEGIEKLETGCAGVRWECSASRSSLFTCLSWTGDMAEIGRRAALHRRNGEQMGDVFLTVTAELYGAISQLAAGDPTGAREASRDAIRKWAQEGFHYQHWFAARNFIWCDLYEEDVPNALVRCDEAMRQVRRAGSLRVQLMAIDAHLLEGRVALAAAHAGVGDRRLHLRRARENAGHLDGLRRLGRAGAAHLRGQIALADGDRSSARSWFDFAALLFGHAEARMHALAARRFAASLAGRPLTEIDVAMRDLGVADPERWCRLYGDSPQRQL